MVRPPGCQVQVAGSAVPHRKRKGINGHDRNKVRSIGDRMLMIAHFLPTLDAPPRASDLRPYRAQDRLASRFRHARACQVVSTNAS